MRRTLSAVAACAAVAVAAVAAAGAGTAASGDVSAAQKVIRQYQQKPRFVPPGPAFDARKLMRGKKVMSIPVSSQIPITQVIEATMAEQAKKIGFTFTTWQNQGKPDQWIQGINSAINQGYDAIDLLAIDPGLVRPQIQQARAKGIKVIESHFAGFGWKVPKFVDGSVRLPYYDVGRILGSWAIVQTKGKTNALAIVANDLASTADVVAGIRKAFAQSCAGCKLTITNVPTADWATGVQTAVSSGLRRDPTVNYLLPIYDAMTQFAVPGVQLAGKTGKVKMASFNGTPFALDFVRQGKVDMNIGENEEWIARAMLDASMRAAAGLKVPANDYVNAPLYIFTKANVAQAGTPPDPAKGYGTAYVPGFAKLWGLSG